MNYTDRPPPAQQVVLYLNVLIEEKLDNGLQDMLTSTLQKMKATTLCLYVEKMISGSQILYTASACSSPT